MSTATLTPSSVNDHGGLAGLGDDDHAQYLLLAGRAGGQSAIGGTGVGDELGLRGSSDAALGRVRVTSPLEVDDVSAGDQVAIRYRPTFTTGGGFIGGLISGTADVTYDSSLFIWALLAETTIYRATVAPGFAAFTLVNALPQIVNAANVNLVQALVLNVGVTHHRATSGTSTTTQTIGMSFSPQIRASVSGAVMTYTTGPTAVNVSPTYSTVAGATVNFGTIRGLRCFAPAVALFQPGVGTENLTAYYGVDFENITFPTSGDKVVVRSAMTDAVDRFFLQNNGGARSDFGQGFILNTRLVQILTDSFGLSLGAAGGDMQILWDGASLRFDPLVGDNLLMDFAIVTGRDTYTWRANSFAGSETNYTELRLGFDRFAFGQTGAVGNQVGVFVAPNRAVGVAGGWADFLLTQAGNLDINGFAMSDVSAWVINAISLDALGGGSISDIATLRVGGMTTSLVGVDTTSALAITGRTVFRGSLNLLPVTAAELTADVNNYQAHLSGNSQRAMVRVSSDASRTVTGFDKAISRNNDTIWITNVGSFDVVLGHQHAGSSAANRMLSPTGANLTLGPDESALLWYDDTTARWRILYTTGA